jgi:hypothetical protein
MLRVFSETGTHLNNTDISLTEITVFFETLLDFVQLVKNIDPELPPTDWRSFISWPGNNDDIE